MTPDQIKDLLHATPFVPFSVYVAAEQKAYEIPHPDFAMLTHKNGVLIVARTDADAAHHISVPLITRIEMAESTSP
ncbi:MAG: hypothetical protein DLM73_14255 [Chthoniobacterales bacterium]|nr:MAG: hypothetical protein DLM73_14255 [Chthoniobacterales bacterium]